MNKLIDTKSLSVIKGKAYDELRTNDKAYNINLTKKLYHFIESICNNIFKIEILQLSKVAILSRLYMNLLKKGAHYLRQDSLQVLRSEMEKNVLFKDNNIASKE
jgi:hypothetical protein